ncbi:MAG: hypothetical protein U5P41_11975 [Gammaproteobacteria bacterium]|nr:hypothetical protein [Gammaproteobacteria bacterium]
MPKVELIYDRDCPNVGPARGQLLRAFAEAGGMPARWREWRRDDPDSPDYVRHYGSPTVLIDGRDIQPVEAGGDNCRIYALPGGGHGPVPAAATWTGWRPAGAGSMAGTSTGVPAAYGARPWGSRFYPNWSARPAGRPMPRWSIRWACLSCCSRSISCRLQLPAPAPDPGPAGSPGGRRPGHWLLDRPGWGFASSTAIVIGKFFYQSNPVAYAGAGLLLVACLWNSWPVSRRRTAGCSDCKPSEPE